MRGENGHKQYRRARWWERCAPRAELERVKIRTRKLCARTLGICTYFDL